MYTEEYLLKVKKLEDFKQECLGSVVTLFTTIQLKPIEIGNMVYYICKDENDMFVPAYCYLCDYTGSESDFKPIYDKYQTCDFGWTDFNEVAKILDVIRNKIMRDEIM